MQHQPETNLPPAHPAADKPEAGAQPPAASNIKISMLLEELKPLDLPALPAGYSITGYRPGDVARWVEIYSAAEEYLTISRELFEREFEGDETALRERMLFLLAPDNAYIGTSTAWADNREPHAPLGRFHWLAIIPACQGRGLARPLVAATLERLRRLGHRSAYLHTSALRVPAVNLYLSFGFVPDIRSPQEHTGWRMLADLVKPQWRATLRRYLDDFNRNKTGRK